MFIGREQELQALTRFYNKSDPQFIVIYGKRRVGKTTLIKEFIKNKPHIYFLGQHITEHENLRLKCLCNPGNSLSDPAKSDNSQDLVL